MKIGEFIAERMRGYYRTGNWFHRDGEVLGEDELQDEFFDDPGSLLIGTRDYSDDCFDEWLEQQGWQLVD